jgi:hypothetical protein
MSSSTSSQQMAGNDRSGNKSQEQTPRRKLFEYTEGSSHETKQITKHGSLYWQHKTFYTRSYRYHSLTTCKLSAARPTVACCLHMQCSYCVRVHAVAAWLSVRSLDVTRYARIWSRDSSVGVVTMYSLKDRGMVVLSRDFSLFKR